MKKRKVARRRPSAKKYNRSKYFVITRKHSFWLFILLASLIGFYLFTSGGFFKIESITCFRDEDQCSEEINAELSRLLGSFLLTFNESKIEEKLKSADPTIHQVKISAQIPDKIIVQINSRSPIIGLSLNETSNILLIDEDGYIFATQDSKDYYDPVMNYDTDLMFSLGDKINEESIVNAIKLVKTLRNHFITFSEIAVEDHLIRLKLDSSTEVMFSAVSEAEGYTKEVTSLQQILSQATIGSKPLTIDIRFEKPVVKME
jgi:cell division septal protein FtsQ